MEQEWTARACEEVPVSLHGEDREGYPAGSSGSCPRAREPEGGCQPCAPSVWFQLRNVSLCVWFHS